MRGGENLMDDTVLRRPGTPQFGDFLRVAAAEFPGVKLILERFVKRIDSVAF